MSHGLVKNIQRFQAFRFFVSAPEVSQNVHGSSKCWKVSRTMVSYLTVLKWKLCAKWLFCMCKNDLTTKNMAVKYPDRQNFLWCQAYKCTEATATVVSCSAIILLEKILSMNQPRQIQLENVLTSLQKYPVFLRLQMLKLPEQWSLSWQSFCENTAYIQCGTTVKDNVLTFVSMNPLTQLDIVLLFP